MLIVSIDTSGKNGSVGLFEDRSPAGGVDISGQIEQLSGGAYSSELIPKLTLLLERAKHSKTDIDAFVVASGPGSFTGLRVGLSTVKALADALNKPIAAVTVLEAVASLASAKGPLLVALDAGRKQVFVGEFQIDGQTRTSIAERLLDVAAFVDELAQKPRTICTPDEAIAEALRQTSSTTMLVPQPRADRYARLGIEKIRAGQTISPAELDANYIRRSDAEIFFKGPK